MNFNETLKAVRDEVKDLMTEENISDEKLEKLTALNNNITELAKQHQVVVENHAKMKDKYIKSVMNFGTKAVPKDETGATQGRTLEEIAIAVLSQK